MKHSLALLREAEQLNPRYRPVRLGIPKILYDLGAYAACSDEIRRVKNLGFHVSDRVGLFCLHAKCLDQLGGHKECWKFCDGCLQQKLPEPVSRRWIVELERVKAISMVDGFCIGRMKEGKRVIEPVSAEFFARIVNDAEFRKATDFSYLARLHEWMEENDDAYKVLSWGESLYPNTWEFAWARASFSLRAGDFERASEFAKRAIELAPWRSAGWAILGAALEKLGSVSDARQARERAEEIERLRGETAAEFD